ncbi:hypothetical protein SAMN05216329_2963 [Curtobacterium sp. YR515]|nr:hypothetical protein SAMN05216329_2963 [Curtobacterium sp. YR515]
MPAGTAPPVRRVRALAGAGRPHRATRCGPGARCGAHDLVRCWPRRGALKRRTECATRHGFALRAPYARAQCRGQRPRHAGAWGANGPAVRRVLSRRSRGGDGHLSRTDVAVGLQRSTRGLGEQPQRPLSDLAPGEVYRADPVTRTPGGLLHHRFTLTDVAAGGLLSVALSRGLLRVGVTHRPALWSPDVPRHSRGSDATVSPTHSRARVYRARGHVEPRNRHRTSGVGRFDVGFVVRSATTARRRVRRSARPGSRRR